MKTKSLLIILFSMAIILSVSSCRKQTEKRIKEKINGTWSKVNVVDVNSEDYEEWHLDKNTFCVIKYVGGGTIIDTIYVGEYVIKERNFERFLSVTKANYDRIVGDWSIHRISNKYLTLCRKKFGLEYLEFTKK